MFKEFISQYAFPAIMAIATAIAGFLAAQIKKVYEKRVNTDLKRKVVETCVKAVEQIYKDMKGSEKLERAKQNIIAMLGNEGITITEIEMDMLIESVVAEFNLPLLQQAKIEKESEKDAETENNSTV